SRTVTDIDGNVYKTVKIGNQWWMAENLRVSKYRNGDEIPDVADASVWGGLDTGARCAYNNNPDNVDLCGYLYNWHAVNDSRNIAPEGWHVPADDEWKTLEKHLGMSQSQADAEGFRGKDEGGKLKEAGTTHWLTPNTGATNESGFTGIPNGSRYYYDGTFERQYSVALFWSSTEKDADRVWSRYLSYEISTVLRSFGNTKNGFSVRLVKD
ncbi:fibrobacter succinogenes major paralogous domain-containing protein, partial [bacterium]|nr:fibrobacter succinogenes major paralogous domain-containing protein [bacterium]